MNIEQILILNTKKNEEANDLIQQALRDIKPLSKFKDVEGDIPLELVEKVIHVICKKYSISIQWISHIVLTSDPVPFWGVSLKTDTNHEWLGSLQGATMYELLAKIAIKMYHLVQTNKIPIRDKNRKRERESLYEEIVRKNV